jgi:phytoene synthase
VSTDPSSAPLASFEAKWTQAYPEFGLALKFDRDHGRDERKAFACLVFELEHAAFGIREAQPAAIKLQWWAEEFARTGAGEARHPLTKSLAARIGEAAIPLRRWQEAIVGAFAQRDAEPFANIAALLDSYARFYEPLGAIESALFGTHAAAVSRALVITRALRETAALSDALRDGKLPLPLDLLARHRLARGELAATSAARTDALHEWFGTLAHEMSPLLTSDAVRTRPLGVLRAAMASADARRALQAAAAVEPLVAMKTALAGLSIPVLWSAWRAARRSRA